jgi:CHAT domain
VQAMALRHGLHTGRADLVLDWMERWRAVTLAVPPVRPPDDAVLAAELAALRLVTRRVVDSDVPHLHRERRRLEARIRDRVRHSSGTGDGQTVTARSRQIQAALGEKLELVELASIDGELHAVHVQRGLIRLYQVGPTASADRALAQTLFAIRREAGGRGGLQLDLDDIVARLQRTLLGPVADLVASDDVVIVPTGQLHAAPWSLLPALRHRAVAVAPSATTWLRARAMEPPPAAAQRVVLVSGPDLVGGAEEVGALERQYPHAVVLGGETATVETVLGQMDGAWLVHLAAHGTFRSDNPLFSAVELSNGPLTGYDLERLERSPHRVVLSSCNSAVGAPTGADELLGIVGPLVSRGCTGVVASVVPVNDPATVPLMVSLHRHLGEGLSLPRALAAAQADTTGPGQLPTARVTAGSFLALGC